jgi:hypothetical protein
VRLVINHLTRMKGARICIAGIDDATGAPVRPITSRHEPLTRDLLVSEGGPFELGALVDVGATTPEPTPPEIEDHRFSPAAARAVRRLDADEYLHLLETVAHDDLETIFGGDLGRPTKWKFAVEAGHGIASLGVLRVQRRPDLEIDEYDGEEKLQLRLNDPEVPAFVKVNDLRFFETDQVSIEKAVVESVRRRMRRGVGVLLMVGLARPFQADGDDRERHWLQVNGICMVDCPLGDRP